MIMFVQKSCSGFNCPLIPDVNFMLQRVCLTDQNSSVRWIRLFSCMGNYAVETIPCLVGTTGNPDHI